MPTNKKKKGKKNQSQNNNNKKKDPPAVEEKPRDPIEEQPNNLATRHSIQQDPNDDPRPANRPDVGGGRKGEREAGEGEELAADTNTTAEEPSPTTRSEQGRQERMKRMVENPASITARRLASVFPDLLACVNKTPETFEVDSFLLRSVCTSLGTEVPGSGLTPSAALAPENKELRDRLLKAIKDMRLGLHLAPELACWWCGQETRKSTKKYCSGCYVAVYCNRDCRQQHASHQPICTEVAQLFKLVRKAWTHVSRAFSDPEDHKRKYGVKPSWKDYDVATNGITFGALLKMEDSLLKDFCFEKGPSMEYFYCNVGHVVHDGFWFHHSAGEPTVLRQGKYNTAGEEPKETDCAETTTIWDILSYAMMFNYKDSEGKLRFDWFGDRLCRMVPYCDKTDAEMKEALAWSASDWLYFYPATPSANLSYGTERLEKIAQSKMYSMLQSEILKGTMAEAQEKKKLEAWMEGVD